MLIAILENRIDEQTAAGAAQDPGETRGADDLGFVERDERVCGDEDGVWLFMHRFGDGVVGQEMDTLGVGITSVAGTFELFDGC